MSFFDNPLESLSNFGSQAADIVGDGFVQYIGREVDEEFDDEVPAPQDDRTFITTGMEAPVNPAGENGFSFAKVANPNNLIMMGGLLVAAVVLVKMVK